MAMNDQRPKDVWTRVPTMKEPLSKVVHELEEDIIFGKLRPRERLIEDVLMERFCIKRHVARQALVVLEQIGIVAREPNKGARVRAFTPEEIEQIYDIRFMLHDKAASLITLPGNHELTTRLTGIHDRFCAAVVSGDPAAVYLADGQFHEALFEACGNPYLIDTIKRYAGIAHGFRAYRLTDESLLGRSKEQHTSMINALETGDREALRALVREHVESSMRVYLAYSKEIVGDNGDV